MADTLQIEVVTPERMVVKDTADDIQIPGKDGYLGILPGHAPLLAALDVGRLSIDTGGSKEEAAVDGGFLHVKDDRVDVLAEHAEMGGDVERFRERAREREQQEREQEEE